MKKTIFLLALAASGCASPPDRRIDQAAYDQAIRDATRQEILCAKSNIAAIDDGISDALTVAFALAIRCNAEYSAVTGAIGASLDNDAQRRMLRDRRAEKNSRIEPFLPVVMWHRQRPR